MESAAQNSSIFHTKEVNRLTGIHHMHDESKTDQTGIDSRRRCRLSETFLPVCGTTKDGTTKSPDRRANAVTCTYRCGRSSSGSMRVLFGDAV